MVHVAIQVMASGSAAVRPATGVLNPLGAGHRSTLEAAEWGPNAEAGTGSQQPAEGTSVLTGLQRLAYRVNRGVLRKPCSSRPAAFTGGVTCCSAARPIGRAGSNLEM